MDLIQALMRLALVDEEWDIKGRQFQEIRERLTNPRELVERREMQEQIEGAAARVRAQLADVELELASLQEHATRVDRDLYGGVITAPRELENLRRDSDQLKHRIGQLEDRGLELMSGSDALEAQVRDGAAEMATFERTWEDGTAEAREGYQVLRARLQELQTEREALRTRVPAREMALYDELRRTKGGRPLAPMRDGICQVCRVSVPRHKATIAEGGLDAVAICEGCGRILYQA